MKRLILLSLLALTAPLLAEPAIQASELPPAIRRMVPSRDLRSTYFPFPNSRLGLLAASLSSGECRLTLLETQSNGRVKVLTGQTVEHDWTPAYAVEVLPLEDSLESGLAVAEEGSTIHILIFDKGLRAPAREFSFYAGDEASPFAMPCYALQRQSDRLVIAEYFSEPDGFGDESDYTDGSETSEDVSAPPTAEPELPPVMFWDGEGFATVREAQPLP